MRTTLSIAVLLIFNKCFSQNLIPNSSFENVNICSEYNAPCAPAAWKTTSPLLPQYLDADSRNKYVGITVFNTSSSDIRQYLQVQLLCPLIKNKLYRFSIKVKPDKAVIESIGILFSDSSLFFEKDKLIKSKPNIELNRIYSSISKRKRKDWIEINAEYKANGNERYVIIGNFQPDSEQKRIFLSKPQDFTDYYYCIDDVCLYSKDSIPLCPEYEIILAKLYNLRERHTLNKHNIFNETRIIQNEFEKESKVDTIRLNCVLFEFNSSNFDTIQKLKLDSLLNKISKENIENIEIFGYTDSTGTETFNLELSIKRAVAIKQVLNELGLSNFITNVKGFGELFPITSNNDENGRKKNRRVEIILKYKLKKTIDNQVSNQ